MTATKTKTKTATKTKISSEPKPDIHLEMASQAVEPKDRRTREGQEQDVIEKIRADKGFTTAWVQEKSYRARTIERLIEQGQIKTRVSPKTKKDSTYQGYSITND